VGCRCAAYSAGGQLGAFDSGSFANTPSLQLHLRGPPTPPVLSSWSGQFAPPSVQPALAVPSMALVLQNLFVWPRRCLTGHSRRPQQLQSGDYHDGKGRGHCHGMPRRVCEPLAALPWALVLSFVNDTFSLQGCSEPRSCRAWRQPVVPAAALPCSNATGGPALSVPLGVAGSGRVCTVPEAAVPLALTAGQAHWQSVAGAGAHASQQLLVPLATWAARRCLSA